MAPSTPKPFMLARVPGKRQSVPTCATSCILQADLGACSSLNDGACLCQSQVFIDSAETCFATTCPTVDDLNTAYSYAWEFCSRFGYTLPTTSYTALPTATQTNAGAGAGASSSTDTPAASSSGAVPTVEPIQPGLYEIPALRPVAIAMPTVCSFILLLTMTLGIMSCRNKIKRERRDAQSRSWTGIGSSRMDSSRGGPSGASAGRFGFKRANNAAAAREALSFQTASGGGTASHGSAFDFARGGSEWDDKSQLRSYSFGNVRAGGGGGDGERGRSYGLMSIDESSGRLGESSMGSGSGTSEGEEINLPVLALHGDGPSPTRSEMTMDSKVTGDSPMDSKADLVSHVK